MFAKSLETSQCLITKSFRISSRDSVGFKISLAGKKQALTLTGVWG